MDVVPWRLRAPVGGQRIGKATAIVEPSLGHPGRLRGHRRFQSGDDTERAQHVVRPYDRCRLPYNYVKYPIWFAVR